MINDMLMHMVGMGNLQTYHFSMCTFSMNNIIIFQTKIGSRLLVSSFGRHSQWVNVSHFYVIAN